MKKVNWIGCLVLFVSFFYVGSASAVIIGFSPLSQTVDVNDIFDIDLIVSDMDVDDTDGSREIVSAFDLDVLFDSSLLAATAVEFGPSLGNPLFFEAFITDSTISAGKVSLAELSLLSDVQLGALQPAPSFVLATLSFKALGEGVSALTIDQNDPYLLGWEGYELTPDFQQSSITVGTVPAPMPVPGTVFLLIAGLLGLRIVNRKI